MAGVKGRSGRKDTLWADALRMEAKERAGQGDVTRLRKLAKIIFDRADEGDVPAMKEIGDRLDGKPAQQQIISGDQENPLNVVSKIERIITRGDAPN